jgi:hypothetical protein
LVLHDQIAAPHLNMKKAFILTPEILFFAHEDYQSLLLCYSEEKAF